MNSEQKWLPMLSRAAAAGLAGLGLALLLSWLAALAMNHDVLPGSDVRLAALVCCGLACLAAGALSPRISANSAVRAAMIRCVASVTAARWSGASYRSLRSTALPALIRIVRRGKSRGNFA